MKRNLIDGSHTFYLNVNQFYKRNEGQFKYEIINSHHWHVHNLKTLITYNLYAHVVDYVVFLSNLSSQQREI